MENTFLGRIVINLGKSKENQLNFQVRKILFVTNGSSGTSYVEGLQNTLHGIFFSGNIR